MVSGDLQEVIAQLWHFELDNSDDPSELLQSAIAVRNSYKHTLLEKIQKRADRGNRTATGDGIFSSDSDDFGFEDITDFLDEGLSDCPSNAK